jgi:hypothetical protein
MQHAQEPRTVEVAESSFIVRTPNNFVVSITYFDDEPQRDFNLRKDEARRLAVAISRLPALLGKDERVRSPSASRRKLFVVVDGKGSQCAF